MVEFEVSNLSVTLQKELILKNLSFSINAGEFICLVGPSGAGKSTLLRQLNRLEPGGAGTVKWRGKNLAEYDVHELRREIAYVFQTAVMFPGSVKDNILLGLRYSAPLSEEETAHRLEEALSVAEIPDSLLTHEAQDISGGQAQRVGIARTLMLNPPVLLLDEPTASLDVETSNHFVKTLAKMKGEAEHRTHIMVTHRLEEAQYLADRVLMLEAGQIVEFTDAKTFFSNPQTTRARDFIAAQKL